MRYWLPLHIVYDLSVFNNTSYLKQSSTDNWARTHAHAHKAISVKWIIARLLACCARNTCNYSQIKNCQGSVSTDLQIYRGDFNEIWQPIESRNVDVDFSRSFLTSSRVRRIISHNFPTVGYFRSRLRKIWI